MVPMRKSFPEVLENLSSIGLKKMALTTNGIFLDKYFDLLQTHGVFHLNISLDSLNAETFQRITFANQAHKVIKIKELTRRKSGSRFHSMRMVKIEMEAPCLGACRSEWSKMVT